MLPDYSPRETISMSADLPIEHPETYPELVHLNDPAMLVLTDFCRFNPVTITAEKTIDFALEKMKYSGIRLLLVVDTNERMVGLISAYKILGAKPVMLEEAARTDRSQITVDMLMTPRSQIKVVDVNQLRDAKVGHIVATLDHIKESYLLVVNGGVIGGLFSASQISKQLGRNIMDLHEPARSLAELIREIG
ncbi:MAG: CBS domain-containing protein [Gammaproteobacteria bacterium]|nr:CBS domain-containing protein [Gammaproteobacteria bacterium]NNJ96976.1 CBS domain-containing protein [Gammaproteobacteria bacterium]